MLKTRQGKEPKMKTGSNTSDVTRLCSFNFIAASSVDMYKRRLDTVLQTGKFAVAVKK